MTIRNMKTKNAVRRNDLTICADILQVAQTAARKTHFVYRANLNSTIIEKYLNTLVESGLLKHSRNKRYLTTRKGIQFLEQLSTPASPPPEETTAPVIPA